MDYETPVLLSSYLTTDFYKTVSGFQSIGDDSAGHCGNDTAGPGVDASCP